MAAEEDKKDDFYSVLGLNKQCSEVELKTAYKKLALRWHPDSCSASGNSKYVEEAKEKFQATQEAYSVLSDTNKRFMYDFRVYDRDDDDNGMGDFLNEMASMMSQNKSNAEHQESHQGGGCVPGEGKSRRSGRRQKVSSGHDVSSSNNAGISD